MRVLDPSNDHFDIAAAVSCPKRLRVDLGRLAREIGVARNKRFSGIIMVASLLPMPSFGAEIKSGRQDGRETPSSTMPLAQQETVLPSVEVISTTPLPGIGIDRELLPYPVQTVPAQAIGQSNAGNLTEFMSQNLTGVNVNVTCSPRLVRQ